MNNRDKLLKQLILEDLTTTDLAERTGISPNNVRRTLDPLVDTGVMIKSRQGREVTYGLQPTYALGLPTYLAASGETKTINQLQELLPMYTLDWNTLTERFARLPVYAARMLHIGIKYEQLQQNVDPDTDAYKKQYGKLVRELRIIRTEMMEDYSRITNIVSIFQQLSSNQEFWLPEVLAKHFTTVTERNGRAREITDRTQVMSILADYVRFQD